MSDNIVSCICDGVVLYCPVHGSNLGYPVNSLEGVRISRGRDWPHDPRTGLLTQPTDEQLGQAMQAFTDNPETFEGTVERIGKATAEDVDEMPVVIGVDWGTGSETVETPREEFSQWLERDGLREGE